MHPCPSSDIPEIQLHQPLSGCFLASPLLSLKLDTPSYTENYYSDVLSLAVIRDWGADLFRGSSFESEIAEEKAWGMALYAPQAWWDNLGHCVRRVYLVGGGEELFRDHIVEFGKLMANVKGIDFESHMEIKEAHDGTYMDFESGRLPSKSTERLARWVIECLQRSQGLVQEL
jgi:acetyl esterase/lipase